jgi:GTP cyclohydrolase I
MSRFIALLQKHNEPIDSASVVAMVREMLNTVIMVVIFIPH